MQKMVNIERKIGTEVSERTFFNLIGGFLCYGFIINMIMVATLGDFARNLNMVVFLIGYFISCIIGAILINKTDNVVVSFIGYNLLVLPIGLLLASALPDYNIKDISFAFLTTGLVTLGMIIISNIKPKVFRKMGMGLFISLLLLILVECVFLLFGVHQGFTNYIACAIFSLYIGYDWVKANDSYKSIGNSILMAANLYLDIVNLFLRILNIKSSDD